MAYRRFQFISAAREVRGYSSKSTRCSAIRRDLRIRVTCSLQMEARSGSDRVVPRKGAVG
jgi:hypothetical protein